MKVDDKLDAEGFEKLLKKTIAPVKCRDVLVGSEYLADMNFVLGKNGDDLPAHKIFLMTASPVFHTIISSCDGDKRISVKINGIEKDTMIEICRFAYTENLKLDQNNMLSILFAAAKLEMKFLKEKVIAYLGKEGMNERTVFKILETNEKEKDMVINMKCFSYIENNHQKCFKTNDFKKLVSEDTLRLMLQTCKLPQIAAKEAIAVWSASNKSVDIEELIALVSLKDYPDESMNNASDNRNSDSESATSNSRAKSVPRGARVRNFKDKKQNQQQWRGSQPNLNQRGNGAPYNNNQNFNGMQNNNRPNQKPGPPRNAPNFAMFGPAKHFAFNGRQIRKNFKFANLNLMTFSKPITITELHFIYDLSTTDKEFEIWIADVTSCRSDLFYEKVFTNNKTNGEYTRYVLPRACQIPANRQIWISIEFNRPEFRLSLENISVENSSSKDLIGLRLDGSTNPLHAQIVQFLLMQD